MIELEKLLNSLYKGVPVEKKALIALCSFSFSNSVSDKKHIFTLLDSVVIDTGASLINNISIYSLDGKYRLKLLINTIE